MIKYFQGKVSQGFVSLYSSRMILRISTALLGLFIPIFLFNLFDQNIRLVFMYYLLGHFLYAVSIAWICQYLNKIGLRRSLRIALLLGAVYYFVFYLIDKSLFFTNFELSFFNLIFVLILFLIVILTFHRAMYWVPMHTDMAKFTSKRNRAKQLSAIEATTLITGAIGPIVAGWIISKYNYDVLFVIVVIVYLLALIPLIYLPRTKERFSWSYIETWKKFFSHKRKKTVIAYMGDGAEGAVGMVIWPIFIFDLLDGNYFEVGALSSLVVLVTIFLQLSVGKRVDKGNKKKMLHWGSVFYAIGWVIKIFIITGFQIFVVSTFHNLTKIFARTPFDALTYEKAADQGHYVDEYTVIHEMAIQFGKLIMLVFAFFLSFYFSVEWVFILAALASLAMNLLAEEEVAERGRHS